MPAAFATAKYLTRCKPLMVGMPTCRKIIQTPYILQLWQPWIHEKDTIQVLSRFWGMTWEQQHPELSTLTPGVQELANVKWHKLLQSKLTPGKKPYGLHCFKQPVPSFPGSACLPDGQGRWKTFSLHKWDHGENFKVNHISHCFQLTDDLETIQGKKSKVSSFHTFQPG